jgi:hypothetical protein
VRFLRFALATMGWAVLWPVIAGHALTPMIGSHHIHFFVGLGGGEAIVLAAMFPWKERK